MYLHTEFSYDCRAGKDGVMTVCDFIITYTDRSGKMEMLQFKSDSFSALDKSVRYSLPGIAHELAHHKISGIPSKVDFPGFAVLALIASIQRHVLLRQGVVLGSLRENVTKKRSLERDVT